MGLKTLLLLVLALLAFAGNSLLNRAALADGGIGWAEFTIIRLVSGAVFLVALVALRYRAFAVPVITKISSWTMPVMLFAYAALFSWAYMGLQAATGALILFAVVQITMQAIAISRGTYPSIGQLAGTLIAFAGLVYLLLPGVTAPPLWPALAMAGAGLAWGAYSWLGRGVADPVRVTAANFAGGALLCLTLLLYVDFDAIISPQGILLAAISGALTSALGYVIWYAVLPHISVTNAAVAQLLVPVIAAIGAVLLLDEALTPRLAIGGLVILAGILLTIFAKQKASPAR